jgi:uncharacterized protein
MPKRIGALLFALATFCYAANVDNPPHTVRASGDATVTATPDRAEIALGVTTTAPTAQAAGGQNANITQHVLESVRSLISGKGELKTAGYSLNPNYEYAPNSKPKLTGYQAVNTIEVKLDDLTLSGKIIDAALAAGATNINGITFTLKDESTVRRKALAQAATKARQDAEAIAQALNLRVVGILEASTGESPILPRPIRMAKMEMSAAAPTPIDPGTLDVHATVSIALLVE